MGFWDVLKKIGIGAAGAIPGVGPLLGVGLSALGGALDNRESARTGKQSGSFNNTSTSTPVELPEWSPFSNLLRDSITKRLSTPVPMEGYKAQGLSNINNASGLIQQSIKNKLVGSGLAGSPIEGNAAIQGELARGSQAVNFLNEAPLQERAMQNQDLQLAMQLFGQRPTGKTLTSTGKSEGTYTQPGSMLGGAFGDAASMLGWLAGQGLLGGKKQPASGGFDIYGGDN